MSKYLLSLIDIQIPLLLSEIIFLILVEILSSLENLGNDEGKYSPVYCLVNLSNWAWVKLSRSYPNPLIVPSSSRNLNL